MKPGMRLSAMMNLPVTYIFTHDSISVGEDGETHEPVEELGNLRSIPNMITFRPADIKELVGCWDYIINNKKAVNLVLSKNKVPFLSYTAIDKVEKGAYIVNNEFPRLSGIIMASGSEVNTALEISESLKKKGIGIRVISVPSLELFNNESDEYKNSLIPVGSKVVVIESSNDKSWYEYVYNKKYVLNIKEFGDSGKKDDVLKKYEFDYETLLNRVENLLK